MLKRWNIPVGLCLLLGGAAWAEDPDYPPRLPDGKTSIVLTGKALLQPGDTLREGVRIASTPPEVHFLYYPGQTYPGNPWSVWGDGSVVGDTYYSAIGDHKSPEGNAFVFSYRAEDGLKPLLDLRTLLNQPAGVYTPGKVHSRVELGKDGWLYFSTHRGSTRIAKDPTAMYRGDWICRHHPQSGKTEIVEHAPLPMQCLPAGRLDPDRMIWFGGTQDGRNEKDPQLLVYDLKNRKVLYRDDAGFSRSLILARSTGVIYYHEKKSSPNVKGGAAPLFRFDPASGKPPARIAAKVGLRDATDETPSHKVYTIDRDALWAFDTKTETATPLGPAAVGTQTYTTSIDVDMKTERYLYYVPGAHGGGQKDGTPIVQFDLKTKTRKVIAFLHPALHDKTGYIPLGTFSSALAPEGDRLYITWNGNRGWKPGDRKTPFNTCALTVIKIPESERQP